MLGWGLLAIALLAAFLGWSGIGGAAVLAKPLFFAALALFVVALLSDFAGKPRQDPG